VPVVLLLDAFAQIGRVPKFPKHHRRRPPERAAWVCWAGGALLRAPRPVVDGGGSLNAALFFVLGTLGFAATFARTEVVFWLGYAGEVSFIGVMYWSHGGDGFAGAVLVFAVVGWLYGLIAGFTSGGRSTCGSLVTGC